MAGHAHPARQVDAKSTVVDGGLRGRGDKYTVEEQVQAYHGTEYVQYTILTNTLTSTLTSTVRQRGSGAMGASTDVWGAMAESKSEEELERRSGQGASGRHLCISAPRWLQTLHGQRAGRLSHSLVVTMDPKARRGAGRGSHRRHPRRRVGPWPP